MRAFFKSFYMKSMVLYTKPALKRINYPEPVFLAVLTGAGSFYWPHAPKPSGNMQSRHSTEGKYVSAEAIFRL